MSAFDLSVTGSWGLYTIASPTARGARWLKRRCSNGERTYDRSGSLMCEGGDRCRAIVAAANRDGLRVEVNGVDMKGYGAPSAGREVPAAK